MPGLDRLYRAQIMQRLPERHAVQRTIGRAG